MEHLQGAEELAQKEHERVATWAARHSDLEVEYEKSLKDSFLNWEKLTKWKVGLLS